MNYLLKYDPDANYMDLKVDELITLPLIKDVAHSVAKMVVETGSKRILADLRAATFDLSVLDIFSTPGVLKGAEIPRQVKQALVVPLSFKDAQFLETVNRNKGYNVMVFRDLKSAKQWLLSDDA